MQTIYQNRFFTFMLLVLLLFLTANTFVQQSLVQQTLLQKNLVQKRSVGQQAIEKGLADNHAPSFAAEHHSARAGADPIPLSFEQNLGQFAPGADFVSRAHGYSLLLTASGATIRVVPKDSDRPEQTLQFLLRGANGQAHGTGIHRVSKKTNYFRPDAQSFTNIPSFEKVQYRDIYPSIDIIYYNNGGKLEYDFVVAPGADPKSIGFRFEGVNQIKLGQKGELQLVTGKNIIKQAKPIAYQYIDGQRKAVASRYYLRETGELNFILGDYDKRLPLVIDPVLSVFSYIGGSDFDSGESIAVDSAGNIYVAGTTYSGDLAVTADAEQMERATQGDIFIAKLTPAGNAVEYLSYFGGSGIDLAKAIAVDKNGNTYVAGITNSQDLSLAEPIQEANAGNFDMFTAKFDPQGNLLFATYLGGANNDNGYSIAVTDNETIYLAGDTFSTNMPTTAQAYDQSCGSDGACDAEFTQGNPVERSDAYLAVMGKNAAGHYQLDYASYFGGKGNDSALAVGVTGDLTAVLTGETNAADFPLRNAFQTTLQGGFNGGYDAFAIAVDPNRAGDKSLVYASYFGGQGEDAGKSIALDARGIVHISGDTNSTDLPTTTHAFQRAFKGGDWDVFAASLDLSKPAQQSLLFCSYLGGIGNDNAKSIAVDRENKIIVSGKTESLNFPYINGTQANYAGHGDGFITQFAVNGQTLTYSTFLGGGGTDAVNALTLSADGQPIVTGETDSASAAAGYAFQALYAGQTDGFVSKLDPKGLSPRSSAVAPKPAQSDGGGGGATDMLFLALLLVALFMNAQFRGWRCS